MTSIIVPAHDEAETISSCLGSLMEDAHPGEFQVVVVANGCSDRTADLARTVHPDVTVVETQVASKANAIRLGESIATRFPRLYVDGDVRMTTRDARAVRDALLTSLAASPRPLYRLELTTWPVRAYYQVWRGRPGVRAGLVGAGVYGLSEEGRERFGEFPDVLADDYFVQQLFAPGERRVVEGASSIVEPPKGLVALVDRRVRVTIGNRAIDGTRASSERGPGLRSLLGQGSGWGSVATFVAVTMIVRVTAVWRRCRGTAGEWTRRPDSVAPGGQLTLCEVKEAREPSTSLVSDAKG